MQVVDQVIRLVRQIAQTEVMPRFLLVLFSRKQDGTPFTEADLASQAALSRTLPAILPCPVLGEEMNPAEQQALWDQAWHDGIWVVDPIDGTTNFVHGGPRSAISLALYRNGEAQLGMVHDPYLKETFWAQKGEGSWCGALRLKVNPCERLKDALLTTGFADEPAAQWEVCRLLQRESHGVRVSGCAALDLAYVACGRVDAFWEVDLKPWDVAAGILLVREAGGVVSDLGGAEAVLDSGNYLATSEALQPELLTALGRLTSS